MTKNVILRVSSTPTFQPERVKTKMFCENVKNKMFYECELTLLDNHADFCLIKYLFCNLLT